VPVERYRARGIPAAILEYDARHPLELASHAGAEAQVAAIADDIAYDAHDLDDGLRAGLFALDDLREVPFLAELLAEIEDRHPGLETTRRIHELSRRVITRFVEDVIRESEARLSALVPKSAEDVRAAGRPVVAFSAPMAEADRTTKEFLFAHMYRHPSVVAVRRQANDIVRDLFRRLAAAPELLPEEWRWELDGAPEGRVIRRISDYIAGMTDNYAVLTHKSLFPATPDLR
jgi:dGTPase